MSLFVQGVVSSILGLCNVVIEKIQNNINTYHVADIEVAHYGKRKRNNVQLKLAILYHLLNGICQKRQPDKCIYPHRVVLLNYGIGAKSVHSGKNNDRNTAKLFLFCYFTKIISTSATAKSCLYQDSKVVGGTTYGKGCMQTILPLDEYGLEGALRVTTAMYFSASRHIYHEIGIEPDYAVELPEEAYEYNFFVLPESLDTQLQTAIAVVKGEQ